MKKTSNTLKMHFIDRAKRMHPYLVIVVFYCVVAMITYSMYGCKVVNDTHRFLEYAEGLKSGFYIDPHNIWYIGYVFFLLACQIMGLSFEWMVFIQYFISLVAVLSLYQTSHLLFHHRFRAFMITLVYIGFIEIMAWNSYLIAESLYLSLTCFSLAALVRLLKVRRGGYDVALAIFIVTITFFTKPTGMALLAAIVAFFAYHVYQQLAKSWIRYLMTFLIITTVLLMANRMLDTFGVIENYQKGEIIYAITELPDRPEYNSLVVKPPESLNLLNPSLPPLLEITGFILQNPVYWFELFIKKIAYFLLHVRPYWSTLHNMFALTCLVPLYLLTCKGLVRLGKPERLFCVTFLLIHILIIGITVVDWDGRFLMPLLPLMFVIASGSRIKVLVRKTK